MHYNRSIIITLLAVLSLCVSTLAHGFQESPYPGDDTPTTPKKPNPMIDPPAPPGERLPPIDIPPTKPPSKWGKVKDNIKKIAKPNPYEIGIGIAIGGLGELVDYVMDPANNAPRLPEPICYYNVVSGAVNSGFYNSYEEVFEKMTPKGSKFIEKRDQYPNYPDLMGNRYYGWYQSLEGGYFHYGDVYKDCTKTKPQEVPQPSPSPQPEPQPSPNPSPSPSPSPEPQPQPSPTISPLSYLHFVTGQVWFVIL